VYEVYSAATLLDKIVERLVEEARDEAIAAAKGLHHPQEPLYAHLKERDVRTLAEPEVGELCRKLAALANRSDLEEELFHTPGGAIWLRVIHRLTGGLPRSVAMAFSVLQGNGYRDQRT
jgi:hypothetical protein